MLDYLENLLGLACREGVIEGGSQVQQYHGAGENSRADEESRRSLSRCLHDKKRGANECRDQSDTMADAVGNFFPPRLFTFGYWR